MARKPTPKKDRFEVFKRDGFRCQYCGKTPPDVVLELDHILAVAKGGENSQDNLITACFDCNRGKGATSLDNVPESVKARAEIILERELQLKEFNKILKKIRKREDGDIDRVNDVFNAYHEGYKLSEHFRSTVRNFLKKIPCEDLCDYMHKACIKVANRESATKYFCGICWNVIREKERV